MSVWTGAQGGGERSIPLLRQWSRARHCTDGNIFPLGDPSDKNVNYPPEKMLVSDDLENHVSNITHWEGKKAAFKARAHVSAAKWDKEERLKQGKCLLSPTMTDQFPSFIYKISSLSTLKHMEVQLRMKKIEQIQSLGPNQVFLLPEVCVTLECD